MSVVVRMEMPQNCCECHLRQDNYDTGEEFCQFTGVECLSIGRQDNCPIVCALPENHGRLVDADAMVDDVKNLWDYATVDRITSSTVLKQVMTDIGNAPTIVPAERSENK